jgi:cytochrome c oxidase subunit II
MRRTTNSITIRAALRQLGMLVWSYLLLPPHALADPSGTNIFSPQSTPAKSIVELSTFVLVITGIIFVVVVILLAYSILKFRATSLTQDREPAQVYGSTQIELAWTIIPILIVVVLFLATARSIHAIQDAPEPDNAVDVTAIGHQYWWEFRYPKLGIVTANEMHVPVSDVSHPTPTFMQLLSADTDHSLDSGACRQDRSCSQPPKPDVDGSASYRNFSRPVRAVLRNPAREDAASRLGRHS